MIFSYSLQICMIANFDPHFYIKYNGNINIEGKYLQQDIRHMNDALPLIYQQYLIKIKMLQ